MPRTKALTKADEAAKCIGGEIARAMQYHGKKGYQVAEYLDIDQATFSRKKNHPERFTIEEIWQMKKLMPTLQVTI
jgi:hypothetical protein